MDNYANPHTENDSPQIEKLTGNKHRYVKVTEVAPVVFTALSQGDEDAFRDIYLHYREPLVEFVNFLIHNREEAKEIAQDIFADLWKNRKNVTNVSNFKSYLLQTARHDAYDYLDRLNVVEKYKDFRRKTGHDYGNDPSEVYIAEELSLLIQLKLDELPETQRRVYEMSRREGLSNDEIAAALKISKKTVENNLSMASKSLKEYVSGLMMILIFLFISR